MAYAYAVAVLRKHMEESAQYRYLYANSLDRDELKRIEWEIDQLGDAANILEEYSK